MKIISIKHKLEIDSNDKIVLEIISFLIEELNLPLDEILSSNSTRDGILYTKIIFIFNLNLSEKQKLDNIAYNILNSKIRFSGLGKDFSRNETEYLQELQGILDYSKFIWGKNEDFILSNLFKNLKK